MFIPARYLRYCFPILFILPLYFFIISDGIDAGIQWPLFRYQITTLGAGIFPLTNDWYYIISGIIAGKSLISIFLLKSSSVLLVIGFLLSMNKRVRISGIFTILCGIFSLGSCIIQYGFLLKGLAGLCIPFGIIIILIFGILLYRAGPDLPGENLLE